MTTRPTPEFVDRWVAALESGDYPKGERSLCRRDPKGGWTFCCLGVAADLAGILDPPELADNAGRRGVAGSKGWTLILPDVNPAGLSLRDQSILAEINDHSATFEPVIAKIREMYPEPADA